MTRGTLLILEMWTLAKMDCHQASMHSYVRILLEVALITYSITVAVTLQSLMDRGIADRTPQTVRFNPDNPIPVRFYQRIHTIQY